MKQVAVRVSYETRRGCGFRKAGGLYLTAPPGASECGRLPLPLEVCPTCGAGIKFTRGWMWVKPRILFETSACSRPAQFCASCSLRPPLPETAGLMWVGEKFYETPEVWLEEALRMGVSKRIATVPRQLELGKTVVLVAHRKVPVGNRLLPAVFASFVPRNVEYVVRGDETPEQLEALRQRGIEPVQVVPVEGEAEEFVQGDLFAGGS